MTFDEWLTYGLQHNFCSEVVCSTHDGIPYTPEEDIEWENGHDPCAFIIRVNVD